jgi:hypothetical protein
MSHHSHEIGIANLPFTRRGRKAAVQLEKDRSKRPFRQSEMPEGSASATTSSASNQFSSAVSMLAPLPLGQAQQPFNPQVQPFMQAQQPLQDPTAHDRWDRMSVLFQSVRDHARGFEYPGPSVAALESVLIRLYLESPIPLIQNGPQGQAVNDTGGVGTADNEINGEAS